MCLRTVPILSIFLSLSCCIFGSTSHQQECDHTRCWIEYEEEFDQGLEMLQKRGQHIVAGEHTGEHTGEHAMNVSEALIADKGSLESLSEKYDKDQGSILVSSELDAMFAQMLRRLWRQDGNCSTSDDGAGATAALDQAGFATVANLCCNFQMEFFIRRVINSMGLKLCQEGGLMRFIPAFTCSDAPTIAELKTRIALARLYPAKAKYPFVEVISKNCPSLLQAEEPKEMDHMRQPRPLKMWDEAKKEMVQSSARKGDDIVFPPKAAQSLLPIGDPLQVRHFSVPAATLQGAATTVRHYSSSSKDGQLPQYAACWDAGSDQASRDAACEGDLKCSRSGFDNRTFGDCERTHCCSEPVLERYAECYAHGADIESRDAACKGDLKCARPGFDNRDFGDCDRSHCCSEAHEAKPADGSNHADDEPELKELKPWDEVLDRYAKCWEHGTDLRSRDAACKGDLKCARRGFEGRDFGDCDFHCCSMEAGDVRQAEEAEQVDGGHLQKQTPWTEQTSEKMGLERYAECWQYGTDLVSRDAACKGDLKCARNGFDDRAFGDCEKTHCCSQELRSDAAEAEADLQVSEAEARLKTEETQNNEGETKQLLGRFSPCWDAGDSIEARDAACEGDLKCSRQGYDNRTFGECDVHCCAKEVLDRYDRCWHHGTDQASRDAACRGDMKCSRRGFDGRVFGDCTEGEGWHCCSVEMSGADLRVSDAQAAVTRIMKRLGTLRDLRTSLTEKAIGLLQSVASVRHSQQERGQS